MGSMVKMPGNRWMKVVIIVYPNGVGNNSIDNYRGQNPINFFLKNDCKKEWE
jgi:hypothetical protein